MSNSAPSNMIDSMNVTSSQATAAAAVGSTTMVQQMQGTADDSVKTTTDNTNNNNNTTTTFDNRTSHNNPAHYHISSSNNNRATTTTGTNIDATATKDNNVNYHFHPSSSSAKEQYSYGVEVAFALNNMAIAMIEQGCIAQSCETFQSAVVAIRSVVTNAENDDKVVAKNLDMCKRVQAAVHHAMNPHPTHLPTTASSVNFLVVSSHWETSLLSSSLTTCNNGSSYTLIRLDDDDQLNNRCFHHSIPAASAVLLYNFAVASFVYFTYDSSETANRYNRLIESVGLLIHAIQHVENEECNSSSAASSTHNFDTFSSASSTSFYYSRILFLLGTALQTLHSCLLALGQRDQAFACLDRLIQIRTMFCVWNESAQMNHLTKPNAAAA